MFYYNGVSEENKSKEYVEMKYGAKSGSGRQGTQNAFGSALMHGSKFGAQGQWGDGKRR